MKSIFFLSVGLALTLYGGNAYSATPEFCDSIKTEDINHCADFWFQRSDEKLNTEYKRLSAGLPVDSKNLLIKTQRLWIAYRDTTCQMYQPDSDGKYSDGSDAGNEAYAEKRNCEIDITESRLLEIGAMLNDGMNHTYYKVKNYISKKFYNYNTEKLEQDLVAEASKNKEWLKYAESSCSLNKKLFEEEEIHCLARLALFDQPQTTDSK